MTNIYVGSSLKLPENSKFEGIGFPMPPEAVAKFNSLLEKIAAGSQRRIEKFQVDFDGAGSSTSFSWATQDLSRSMNLKAADAADFMDSLWRALQSAEDWGEDVPRHPTLNRILDASGVPLRIVAGGRLERTDGDAVVVDAAPETATLDDASRYVLGKELGRGGYGVVYRATRRTSISDFDFALKMLDPSPFIKSRDKALKRFKREVDAIKSLQHRAIVPYVEAGIAADEKPYVVMPLIVGKDLRTAGSGDGKLAIHLMKEVLSGLAYAHESGVLHRDLKPTNVIVRATDNQPLILDFGSAYLLDQLTTSSLTTEAVGTLGYIPSEVLVDPRVRTATQDVYACGIILYEMIVGRRPDPADYSPIRDSTPELGWLDAIIQAAIAPASRRLPSASEFRGLLREGR